MEKILKFIPKEHQEKFQASLLQYIDAAFKARYNVLAAQRITPPETDDSFKVVDYSKRKRAKPTSASPPPSSPEPSTSRVQENPRQKKRTAKTSTPSSSSGGSAMETDEISSEDEKSTTSPPKTKIAAKKPATSKAPAAKKPKRPPPIYLRSETNWAEVIRHQDEADADIEPAKLIKETVKIQPKTIDDFRKTTRFLDNQKLAYHTYQLQDEKTLKVVLRGIQVNISEEDIKEELTCELRFPVFQVRRMRSGKDRKPIPLVMVELDRTQDAKEIYNLKSLFQLKIQVESLRRNGQTSQCHRCQKIGHAANCCRAPPKCVKCAGDHLSATCTHTKDKGPARCANCNGPHPANYRGCSGFQKNG